ncbi:hypothetical protein ANN_19135 [Periplaneta americana]|uniref:Uncharacterized protein n=1 Tax=Periplaneta americana TaxID=6978 RepID=A0ABQ8S9C4_PERAM|nr:hypothetical protein ANN_19135 [Periplaneta americana]
MMQDDQVAIPKCNNISITILSPKNWCDNVTDEDSGDENNPTIYNMPGSQLRAETEVTLNAQGEGMDDYDDESHNGDDEHSKGDGENGSRNTSDSATDIQVRPVVRDESCATLFKHNIPTRRNEIHAKNYGP